VASDGAAAAAMARSTEAKKSRTVTFSLAPVHIHAKHGGSQQKATRTHAEVSTRDGRQGGANSTQHAGVVESSSAPVVAGGDGIESVVVPTWTPATGTRSNGCVAVDSGGRGNSPAAVVQRGQSFGPGVQQEADQRLEELRMGALMEDSVAGVSGGVICDHTVRPWQRGQPSSPSGAVVVAGAECGASSERRRGVVEAHGLLCVEFPIETRPPTPHAALVRMR
jgi:hypothetical protein